jgi:hypothetical protein
MLAFREILFGKKKMPNFQQVRNLDWNAPDADGVVRTFSKELWDDPEIGALLISAGINPNDPRNIQKTMDDYRAEFGVAKARLDNLVSSTNAENAQLYGHCVVASFLIIDGPIWDGEHGAFLFGQLGLCAYHDWNVMLLATDIETVLRCPFLPHVGSNPALFTAAIDKVATLHRLYDEGLASFGLTAIGQRGGIGRVDWDLMQDRIRDELMSFANNARKVVTKELEHFKAEILAGKIKI